MVWELVRLPHFKPLKQNFHIAGADLRKLWKRSLYLGSLIITLFVLLPLSQQESSLSYILLPANHNLTIIL